jgi:hypothetical protein
MWSIVSRLELGWMDQWNAGYVFRYGIYNRPAVSRFFFFFFFFLGELTS